MHECVHGYYFPLVLLFLEFHLIFYAVQDRMNLMRQKDNGKCLTALVIEEPSSLVEISSDLFVLSLN